MSIFSDYIEIDSELINLSKITKIKKVKTGGAIYSIVLEENGKIVKIVKYSTIESMEEFYMFLKTKLVPEDGDNMISYDIDVRHSVEELGLRLTGNINNA